MKKIRNGVLLGSLLWIGWAGSVHAQHAESSHERVPVQIPESQQTQMGLKTSSVQRLPIEHTLKALGILETNPGKEVHFHSRVSGWIEEIFVDAVGKTVRKGEPLLSFYSPDLVTTQGEYIAALRIGSGGREVAQTALKRLQYWGVPEKEIRDITKRKELKRLITFEAPIDGYVVTKNAIQGHYVTPDMDLYHFADLSKLWILATLYEADLTFVKIGDEVQVTLPYDATQRFLGRVSYLYPDIEKNTRTGKARIEIDNSQGVFKPGMFAHVEIRKNLGVQLVISEDSVIDTGTRKIVFVQNGTLDFEPREIKIGPRTSGQFVVLEGLKENEKIVTAANFLLDAESKLQAALKKGSPIQPGHGEHGKK